MKRYIKCSFGYRDEDWINPPEEQWEDEGGEIDINVKNIPATVTDNGDMFEFVNSPFEDYEDPDYGNLVITGEDLEEKFYDAIDWDVVPTEDGNYFVSFEFVVDYSEYVSTIKPRNEYDEIPDPEAEVESNGKILSISFKPAK